MHIRDRDTIPIKDTIQHFDCVLSVKNVPNPLTFCFNSSHSQHHTEAVSRFILFLYTQYPSFKKKSKNGMHKKIKKQTNKNPEPTMSVEPSPGMVKHACDLSNTAG